MRRRLFFWELAGFLFTGALGTALHFVYDWSGRAPAAAVFSAVNESTWEHMKLLFVPVFLFSVIQMGFLGRDCPHLLWCRALSALAGLALIPVLFYTYTGVLGYHVVWADIAVFFFGGRGAVCPGRLAAAPGKAAGPVAAGGRAGGAVGADVRLCALHRPPAPHRPVAGPCDGTVRRHAVKKRPSGALSHFLPAAGVHIDFTSPRLDPGGIPQYNISVK